MRAKNLPGAGQYNTYKAVGKQPLSSKKTLPAHSFGKSTRDACKKSASNDPSLDLLSVNVLYSSWLVCGDDCMADMQHDFDNCS